jgi:cytochrome c oxidase subunit 2
MSPAPTTHVETVDFVMLYIVGISVILLLGVTATMIYFVFKYHRKKGHKPVDIPHNTLLEVIWIVVPTILVLSMFYYGYTGFAESRKIPDNAFESKATARMWAWEFNYANGIKTDTMYVPVNTPIMVELKSVDVTHSMYIRLSELKRMFYQAVLIILHSLQNKPAITI